MANRQAKTTEHTVFVRFNPPSSLLRRHHIENHFSQIGPIKKASLIIPKASTGGKDEAGDAPKVASSYGFIKYTCASDASLAASQLNRSTLTLPPDDQSSYGEASSFNVTVELAAVQMSKQQKLQQLGKKKTDTKKEQKEGDDDHDGDDDDNDDTTDGPTKQERRDKNKAQMEEAILQSKKKHNRIILRNLSFYAKASHIEEAMAPYGKVLDVHLPTVQGKSRGFAFCTFATPAEAQKALTAAKPTSSSSADAGITIKQRKVQADWSVSKRQHQQQQETDEKNQRKQEYQSKLVRDQHQASGRNTSNKDDDDDKDGEDDDDDSGSDSDSDDDDSSDDGSGSSDSEGDEKEGTKAAAADDDDSEDDDDDDDDDEDSVNEKQNAISEQRELFCRNLPFDASRHDVFQAFRKYGTISAVYIVMDSTTKLPRGTCFVTFEKHAGAVRAMNAAAGGDGSSGAPSSSNNSNTNNKEEGQAAATSVGNGIVIKTRNLIVDYAVDRETATTLKRDPSADGNQHIQHGKDKRNVYLKGEGRVDVDAQWAALGENDQTKRQRAWSDKISKLKSPLFFINPYRVSIRNLAKGVEEGPLKKLLFEAAQRGLERKLVSVQDVVMHLKASGEKTPREILEVTKAMKSKTIPDSENPLHPASLDAKNAKLAIPSVYLDRNFEAAPAKGTKQANGKKALAPSRGFAFAEFTHHVQGLACLRELNNNPAYSEEFAVGGRAAANSARARKGSKKKKKEADAADGDVADSAKIPRLIVEFTVENKAKARQQAERRAHQQANRQKNRLESKEKRELAASTKPVKKSKGGDDDDKDDSKALGRGAKQREKKRLRREKDQDGSSEEPSSAANKAETQKRKFDENKNEKREFEKKKPKSVKPPKKPSKREREETEQDEQFSQMVNKYKAAFGGADKKAKKEKTAPVEPQKALRDGTRWFE